MEKFEQQFENLDVQSNYMETAMSDTATLTVPQVRPMLFLLLTVQLITFLCTGLLHNMAVFSDLTGPDCLLTSKCEPQKIKCQVQLLIGTPRFLFFFFFFLSMPASFTE